MEIRKERVENHEKVCRKRIVGNFLYMNNC